MADERQRFRRAGEIESEDEEFRSLDLCDRTAMGRRGRSPEPVATAKNLWKRATAMLKNKTYSLPPTTSEDHVPIRVSSACDIYEGVQLTEMAMVASPVDQWPRGPPQQQQPQL
ncbi:uncharacterized protein LOC125542801 isoform X3 [Triticum urartu]|uniref:uncharacterized protein LOC125542801 isoform X3 n=1 Tax=Triticum urartu TaxID=4572 RepID=UPI0020441F07|nr:uncharacterized protein LOC125542801 isoform X3 [Triticum urartu]